jgi:hypothetical protein
MFQICPLRVSIFKHKLGFDGFSYAIFTSLTSSEPANPFQPNRQRRIPENEERIFTVLEWVSDKALVGGM